MNETAGMLEARLGLIDRIRRVEHALAREEQARVATTLMRGRVHELGNAVQIVQLSAQELARRVEAGETGDLVRDLRAAADHAAAVLADMIAATRPVRRVEPGPVVTHVVRAAIELARPAIAAPIDLRIELDDTVHTPCSAEELDAIVLAAALDAAAVATRITFVLRERVIQSRRWVELLRIDDRQQFAEGELAHMFEPHALLHVVAGAARQAGGEASLAPGRGGLELVVELPIVDALRAASASSPVQSSSSS
jgi:nitrogen-specific signal transduction histidine kinase